MPRTMVTLRCSYCKNLFEIEECEFNRGGGKYCSQKCFSDYCRDPNTIKKRFWAFINIGKKKDCWVWTGGFRTDGYGLFGYRIDGKTKLISAHKFSYIIYYGKIRDGLFVLHDCDNKACCNPHHLFLGTQQDNMDDKVLKGRQSCGEKHYKAILTVKKVQKILLLRRLGFHKRDIANMLNISISRVYAVLGRHAWKSVKI